MRNSLTIKGKVFALFFCLLLTMVLLVANGLKSVNSVNELFYEIRTSELSRTELLNIVEKISKLRFFLQGKNKNTLVSIEQFKSIVLEVRDSYANLEKIKLVNPPSLPGELTDQSELFSLFIQHIDTLRTENLRFQQFHSRLLIDVDSIITQSLQPVSNTEENQILVDIKQWLLSTSLFDQYKNLNNQWLVTAGKYKQELAILKQRKASAKLQITGLVTDLDALIQAYLNTQSLWVKLTTDLVHIENRYQDFLKYAFLQVEQSDKVFDKEFQDIVKNKWLVVIVVSLLSVLIAIFLILSTVIPLKKITNAFRLLSIGELDIEIPGKHRKDELGELAFTAGILIEKSQQTATLLENSKRLVTEQEATNKALKQEIEQRQQVEYDLVKAREAAELANYQKSLFVTNVTHELKTPLSGILGMLSLLDATKLTPEQKEYIDYALKSGDATLAMIHNMLDYTTLEAGRISLQRKPFLLCSLVEEVIFLSAFRAAQKQIVLLYDIASYLPEQLEGDVARIRQVLLNLVSHTIQHTDQGYIALDVQGHTSIDEAVVKFIIHDSGQLITWDLFDERYTSAAQENESADSIGVAIARQLAELMWGKLEKSTLDNPARFTLTLSLPTVCTTDPLMNKPALSSQSLLKGIWLGESSIVYNYLACLAKKVNLHLVHLSSLTELANWVGKNSLQEYQCILISSELMSESYPKLLQHIRAVHPAIRQLAIIWYSLFPRCGEANQFKVVGFNGYLSHPTKHKDFLTLCHALLNKSHGFITRYIQPDIELPEVFDVSQMADENTGQLKVLVAEDNPVNQKVAARMLSKLQCKVSVANNGQEAVNMWQSQGFDLIVMDCNMPVMDGYDATRQIRSLEPERSHIYIVALTANALEGEREKCFQAGMDHYLTKPVKLVDFQQLIDEVRDHACSSDTAEMV
ncbi:response regulator [Zooshikella harenae]|uniref:histidine kinase n=1 Tax=Zooshikella harenae TaxID=2827238 RepID=A0ABS5Z7V6_9GAMM|nr:response regulator [Zooshikella harenae]MBU2710126.1 response regulator [Zooshikella harenae]